MAYTITDPWGGDIHLSADSVFEPETRATHSRILGPDGKPLPLPPRERIGFDLPHRRKPLERKP